MKRVITHPEEPQTGKRYWRSLSEFARTEEFQTKLEREFSDGQAELKDSEEAETSRRGFLKLMGASTALAGLASCRRPEKYILPYAKPPEWVIPGKALFYATAMPQAGGCAPLVVTSYEGRPTHLAANPLHPEAGGLDAITQASVLGLYDPYRSRDFLKAGQKSTREEFLKEMGDKKAAIAGANGKGFAILLDAKTTPTRDRLVAEIVTKLPEVKVFRYEALAATRLIEGNKQAYGEDVVALYHFDKAEKVLSLDCDFMGLDRLGNKSTAQFMAGRKAEKPGDPMNRLYAVEGRYSLTGGMADHRLRIAPSQIVKVAKMLAAKLGVGNAPMEDVGHPDAAVWIEEAAKDLAASKGKALVVAGVHHPVEVHLLVAAINNALGALGATMELRQAPKSLAAGSLADLLKAVDAKEITGVLALTEADPAFDAPADLKFVERMKSAELVLLSTRHRTATARMAAWALPAAHYLEQWGDTRATDGTYSIVQPMILPLFGGVSDVELLSLLLAEPAPAVAPAPVVAPAAAGTPAAPAVASAAAPAAPVAVAAPAEAEAPGMAAVRATFDAICPAANKNDAWNFALRDGFVPSTAYPAGGAYKDVTAAAMAAVAPAAPTKENMELDIIPCAKIYDGRHVNNGWLQEAPDPVSKATWDNAALISVKTARHLGVKNMTIDENADVISVKVNGGELKLPLVVVPGMADWTVTVALGYGQAGQGSEGPGLVGEGTGTNVFPVRTSSSPYFSSNAQVARLDEFSKLALTQEHSAMYGRALVREGTVDDWKEEPDFVLSQGTEAHLHGTRSEKDAENKISFYKPVDTKGKPHLFDDIHQWGMVIDLNSCIGCNSCLVACQSENNIPIVGKGQVIRGREMHWIRMDRYFATDLDSERIPEKKPFGLGKDVWDEDFLDEPEMVVQPVACQHCESAPCETVCPVNATVHSEDGLNVMAYNRCIGTRYCANNCPFKARRFNFFDYNKRNPLVETSTLGIKHNNLYSGAIGERHDTELSKLQKNPNVTVRMRGVMEKCTYCVQRIESARIETRAKARKKAARETGIYDENLVVDKSKLQIPTNSLKTACQEACPANAIVFGNQLDKNSDLVKAQGNSRRYELLGYLAISARTTYLGRIKNPNPALTSKIEWERRKAGNATKYHVEAHHGGAEHAAEHPAHEHP